MSVRREEILDVARQEFARNGYAATSMRTLGDACGVMAGSLYSHFASKAEVVAEIVLRFYDELLPAQRAALESDGDGATRLAAMIDAVYRTCAAHDLELIILHYDWRVLANLEGMTEVVRRSDETLQMWETVVAAGEADGSLRSGIDPRAVMRIVTSSIHGLLDFVRHEATRSALGAPVESRADANATVALLEMLVLHGMRAPG